MIGDTIEAVPEDGQSIFEAPEKRVATRRKVQNMMPLPSVSGFDDYDDEDGKVEMLYDEAHSDGEGEGEVDVAKLDTEENRECLERVKRGFQNFYKLYWDLARDMYLVNTSRLYRLAGYKTFDDYVNTELQFSKRKADYLVNVYKYYAITLKSKLSDQPQVYSDIIGKVKQIGWTKAERIAKRNVLDADNAKELFDRFTKTNDRGKLPSTPQIEDMVEKAHAAKNEEQRLDADEENVIQKKSLHFNFTMAQYNTVAEAMSIAKNIAPQNSKPSTIMNWVCAAYVATYQAEHGKEVDLKATMQEFERLLEVDIIILDRVSGEVKFGSEAAKALKNSPG